MKIHNSVVFTLCTLLLSSAGAIAPPSTLVAFAQQSSVESIPERQDVEKLETLADRTIEENSKIRAIIQSEVDRATIPNTILLVIVVLFPALAFVLFVLGLDKLRQHRDVHKQELESFQTDAIAQIKMTIAEAEATLVKLTENKRLTEEEIDRVKSSVAQELQEIAAETEKARDEIYRKLAEFLPRLTQNSNGSNGQGVKASPTPSENAQPNVAAGEEVKQGDTLFMEGRYQEAISCYDRAISIQAEFPEAWNNRGGALAKMQRYEEAIASYDNALALKPEFPEALNNRGGALAKMQRYEEAIASYKKAVELKQSDPLIWLNMANVLAKLQRYEEAIFAYDRAISAGAKDSIIWQNRGNALVRLQRYDLAIESYDRALEGKQEDPDLWYARGYVLYELQRYEESLASYDKSVQLQPAKADAWNNRGNALEKLQRYQEAIASYEKALQLQADKYESWDNRGYTLARLGRHQEAIASLERSLKIKPDHANAYYNKAYCYASLGDVKGSLTSLHRAIKLNSMYREIAKNDPDLDTVRGHRVFKQLVAGELKLAS